MLPARLTKLQSGDPALKRVVFAIPGKLDTPTGGYIYDRMVVNGLRDSGWQVDVVSLGEGFPTPQESTRQRALDLAIKVAAEKAAPITVPEQPKTPATNV